MICIYCIFYPVYQPKMNLSNEEIDKIEAFIAGNEPHQHKYSSAISMGEVNYGIEQYETIKTMPVTTRLHFASNAMGFTAYMLYKAKNEKIYVLQAYMQTLTGYNITESKNWFTD